jgi:CBS domain-containing protein
VSRGDETNEFLDTSTATSQKLDVKPPSAAADDSVDEALRTMTEHKVRRLPVIDGHDLVGVVSQADVATNVDDEKVGDLVEAISAAP